MPKLKGYAGQSLEFLEKQDIQVGDSVKVLADLTYYGVIMPRYEHSDDRHVVLKLTNGYNVGIEIGKIREIEKIETRQEEVQQKQKVQEDPTLPRVLLISTGGTIASKIDYRTGAVTPTLTADELYSSVPELADMVNIDTEVLFSEYSENIMPDHWLKLAQKINELSESDYAGIIVAHGTDTMHYTSSFLSFALAGFPIPVVLVGSQRSSDRASSDAALNLIGAAKFITGCKARGIFVAMHQDENDEKIACHFGTRVRKNHTSKRGAFQTIGASPAFVIDEKIQKNASEDFFRVSRFQPRIKLDTKAVLVKYYPGYDPELLEKILDMGTKAIIFEGTGLGHIGKSMYAVVRKASEKGVFMGMTSQCIEGRIRMTVYESGRDLLNLGIVPLKDMIPEVALVKAMWVLGIAEKPEQVKDIMLENISSEISE